MKNRKLLLVGVLVLAGAGSELLACGDKFLVISRGTRYQRAAILRKPAAILVYANPASTLPRSLARVRVEDTLSRVGYRTTSVSSPVELDQALRRGGWDLVVADLADSTALRGRYAGTAAPMVLPVLYDAGRSDVAQARKEYGHAIKGPVKSQAFLDAVDEALALRANAAD
jgi:hypothetical protein